MELVRGVRASLRGDDTTECRCHGFTVTRDADRRERGRSGYGAQEFLAVANAVRHSVPPGIRKCEWRRLGE